MMHCFISQRQAPRHGAHACTASLQHGINQTCRRCPAPSCCSVCPPQPPRPQPLPAWQRARAVNALRHAGSQATTNVLTHMQQGCLRPSCALLISCSGPLLRPYRCASCVSCTPHRSFVIPLLRIHLICPRSKLMPVMLLRSLLRKPACRPRAERSGVNLVLFKAPLPKWLLRCNTYRSNRRGDQARRHLRLRRRRRGTVGGGTPHGDAGRCLRASFAIPPHDINAVDLLTAALRRSDGHVLIGAAVRSASVAGSADGALQRPSGSPGCT